jgi:hypothetical protein
MSYVLLAFIVVTIAIGCGIAIGLSKWFDRLMIDIAMWLEKKVG